MALAPTHFDPREGAHHIEMRFMLAQDGDRPSEKQLAAQRELREALHYAAKILNTGVEDSREKSLALTKIEEGLMWAGKAIFK